MERITIQTILEIEDLLEVSAKKGRFEPELFLPTLKDKGFYTCAYYDAVPNIASDDYQLYLAAICCENDQKKYIGSSVQFRETSLSRGHLKKRPHIQEAEDCYQTDKLKKHTDCLCITDKLRIHVPIFVDELLIGALSCSWGGSVSLDEEQVDMFWMLGKMFSTYWQMANSNLAHSLFDEIKDTLTSKRFEQNSVYDILEMATQLVGQAFDTEVVALFEYNWYSDKLIKIHEWNTFANHRDNIEEEYQSGQFLTGKAWKYKKHRNIVDFDEFMKEYDKDIELKSLEYHQNLLTEIKTILYYPFGTKTRYLFRLVNRSNNEVSFPFLSSHKIVLTSVLDKLGTLIDDVVDAQRMNHLQSVSKSAISNISSNEKTLDSIKNALSLEGVRHLGMMAYTGNNIHFTHKYFSENNYLSQIQTHCSWEDDDFYKKCIDVEGISVLKLSDFREALKVNNLLKALVKDSITCVVIVPFSSLVIHGFFIVVPPQNLNYTYKLSLARLPEFHKRSLATYAGIVAGGIESADS
ncbi:MAG TPA: hypothetical protein EYG73_09805, partial [Arcobacter sp.]|nr:hypothetical protein [Arcobacter sp.]